MEDVKELADGTFDVDPLLAKMRALSNELAQAKVPNAFIRYVKGVPSALVQQVTELGNVCRMVSQLIEHGAVHAEKKVQMLEELRQSELVYKRLSYLELQSRGEKFR